MSVYLFSSDEVSIVANFAQKIRLGDAANIGLMLATQNADAFNSRHSNSAEKVKFVLNPDAILTYDRSLSALIRDLMVNSFISNEETPAYILLCRIFRNSIAMEFGQQEFHAYIGKQCRVKHSYNLIHYIVGELKHGYRIATLDDERNIFRIFNAHKEAVDVLGCNQLSLQQVSTLTYKIENPILKGKSVFLENNTLTAFKNHPETDFTIELKRQASTSMIDSLEKFKARNVSKNIWKVSANIIVVLRELCPRGSVYI
jgi:hypothetical protein